MYQQVTLATCQARLRDRVESVPWWTDAEATSALNESLHLWNALTGFWRSPFLTVAIPNDPYVPLPGTLVQSARVTWNGLPLEPCSLADLDYCWPNWRATTTATPGAPSRPVYWARLSLQLLAIYPADAFGSPVAGTHSLLIHGIRSTPILSDPEDYIDIGQETLNLLLGYAQHVLAFKIGGQALIASYPAWLAFLSAGAAQNRRFAASAFYRKLLGLDQQRRLFPQGVAVPTPVDPALAEADEYQLPSTRIRQG